MLLAEYLKKLAENHAPPSVMGFAMDSADCCPRVRKKKLRNIEIMSMREQNEYSTPDQQARIMVDFDRTIFDYNGWGDGDIDGDPLPGAVEAIRQLKDRGYKIIIFTTRASPTQAKLSGTSEKDQIRLVGRWLEQHDIPFDGITGEKLGALAYIDDKAVEFTNWNEVMKKLRSKNLI